ncbi:alpha/beta fold hydrolase [Hydrogenophaga taeniospiralis]|nr:alpha/beta fold hydrolase [Hydrogenophaga taeniospiralis]
MFDRPVADSNEGTAVHPASGLARLQQGLMLGSLALAAGWSLWAWSWSGHAALLGVLVLLGGYAVVLALEFVVVGVVNRSDPTPRAHAGTLLCAWWQEVRVAPRVFSWRQPFRWRCLPDEDVPPAPGRTAVVFVHGFVCNRGFWLPWMHELRQRGVPYTSVNLEPVFGSIDTYGPLIDDAVRRAYALTGQPPMLVCHSMGGLAARAWLDAVPGADRRVSRIVTIGSPHHGTWLAQFSRVDNGRQMRIGGDWLRSLQAREAATAPNHRYDRFVCWYSNADNIVFPAATARLPGADNRHVPGVSHVAMAFHPQVMRDTLALLPKVQLAAA